MQEAGCGGRCPRERLRTSTTEADSNDESRCNLPNIALSINIEMSFYTPSNSNFTRLYQEEVDIVFSGIDCVLNDERAIYCSSELTTGTRLYDALREHKLKTAAELQKKLGDAWYRTNIFDANVKLGKEFAQCVRGALSDNTMIITPAPFFAPTWTQPEYLFFWETLLRTRIKSAWFNHNWQFSNGCTFEFAVARDAAIPTLDHNGKTLEVDEAIQLIDLAIRRLDTDGFDTLKLAENLERLHAKRAHRGVFSAV